MPMDRPVYYDLSRLALRLSRPVPSGIDRVDLAWARAVFASSSFDASGIVLGALGQRVVSRAAARAVIAALERRWGEKISAEADPAFQWARARLLGETAAALPALSRRGVRATAAEALALFRAAPLGRDGLFPGRDPIVAIPEGATYVNVSQFPLAHPRMTRWLSRRRDLAGVIMVHDVLPITCPEFFPPKEQAQHLRFIDQAARTASVLVVTGLATAESLTCILTERGLPQPRIEIASLSVDPVFRAPPEIDEALVAQPFFVVCGTIEPRKNHLLLLNVWRELARELGNLTPKLVIVGARGWENENVLDLLERSDELRPHVIEVSGLSTPGLKRLLDNCRSLLMPSFAEGFGLPVAEAAAAGVPVVASNMPHLIGLDGSEIELIDPIDGLGWLESIRERTHWPPATAASRLTHRSESAAMCSNSNATTVIQGLRCKQHPST